MGRVRNERASSDYGRVDKNVAACIKGMLLRGDKQSDIAAFFSINAGRVAEINTGERFPEVKPRSSQLPPPGPYPSPHEMWKSQLALQHAQAAINWALEELTKAGRK